MKKLEEKLNKIGWSIRGEYPRAYIYDHNNKKTIYKVNPDGVDVIGVSENSCVSFNFKGAEIKMVENDCVSLGTDECFVLFMNYDIKKRNSTP